MARSYAGIPVALTEVWLDPADFTVVAVCERCGVQAGPFPREASDVGSAAWEWGRAHWQIEHDGRKAKVTGCALRSEGCKGPHKQGGLCGRHFEMRKVHGPEHWRTQPISGPASPKVVDPDTLPRCADQDCDRPANGSRGLCTMHYQRAREPHVTRYCTAPGCERAYLAKGWCSTHYSRMRDHGSLDLPNRTPKTCSARDCDRAATGRGLCATHYSSARRGGQFL